VAALMAKLWSFYQAWIKNAAQMTNKTIKTVKQLQQINFSGIY
jgi:hypothetical protein